MPTAAAQLPTATPPIIIANSPNTGGAAVGSQGNVATPKFIIANPRGEATPMTGAAPSGLTPAQITQAYGFNQISFNNGAIKGDGSGQTIAIVDAYDDPNVSSDLQAFDQQFGLPSANLKVVNENGGTALPGADSSGNWEVEESLDVEWAHAVAPGANIVLVEAASPNMSDLFNAVQTAAGMPGVSVVSMSWGGGEFSGENSYDSYFTTPTGHSGVSFIAASGDYGAPVSYPAVSPNVLSVGGTTLNVNSQNNWSSETGWSGSGGGLSSYESQPSYQNGVVTQSTTQRANPDVAYNADPNTGYAVYDSYPVSGYNGPWLKVGGTSAGSPQWAGLVAIADQGRALNGQGSLDGGSQLLPKLYQMPSSDFHDVTSGTSTGYPSYSAGPGYDLVTGRGTPIANLVVNALTGSAAPTSSDHFVISTVPSTTAGTPFSLTVTAYNASNQVDTSYAGTVHFTTTDTGTGVVLPADYTFTAAEDGQHTFSNAVTLVTARSQTLTATDTSNSASTGRASVTVNPAAPSQLVFGQEPTNTAAGATISPPVTVRIEDKYNNVVTTDSTDQVALAIGNNPGNGTLSGTTTMTASNGVATFSNLSINNAGNGYTLAANSATNPSLPAANSTAFNVTSGLTFSSQDVPAPIQGGYYTLSSITINQHVPIQDLKAQLNITYPSDSDLDVELESPNGTFVDLATFEGMGANFNNTIFDDNAATPISAGNSPFNGSYQPESPLSAVAGQDAYGTWTLWVGDWGYASGTLNSWSLMVQPSTTPSTQMNNPQLVQANGQAPVPVAGSGPSSSIPASAAPPTLHSSETAMRDAGKGLPSLASASLSLTAGDSVLHTSSPAGQPYALVPVATTGIPANSFLTLMQPGRREPALIWDILHHVAQASNTPFPALKG